jgi:hypothetical protein
MKIKFGTPLDPPVETEISEVSYDKLTSELKARVVAMWEELHGIGTQSS